MSKWSKIANNDIEFPKIKKIIKNNKTNKLVFKAENMTNCKQLEDLYKIIKHVKRMSIIVKIYIFSKLSTLS